MSYPFDVPDTIALLNSRMDRAYQSARYAQTLVEGCQTAYRGCNERYFRDDVQGTLDRPGGIEPAKAVRGKCSSPADIIRETLQKLIAEAQSALDLLP